MSSSEEYLDDLLASALQNNKNPNSDGSDMSSLDLGTEENNSNRMMSEEEIAALIQNMNTEPEAETDIPASSLSRFGKHEEIDESVTEALQKHKDDNTVYSSVNVSESVSEALSNTKEDKAAHSLSDKKNNYTQDEIDNKADELLALLQDGNKSDDSFEDSYDFEDETDDVEARIKAAEQQGMNAAAKAGLMGLSLSEEAMDFTDFVEAKGIENSEISQAVELLKKSDDGKLIDEASLPKQDFSDALDLSGNSLVGISEMDPEKSAEDSTEDKKKKKGKKEKKSRKHKNDNRDTLDIDNSPEDEAGNNGLKKSKRKAKNNKNKEINLENDNKNKKKKGLFWFLSKDKGQNSSDLQESGDGFNDISLKGIMSDNSENISIGEAVSSASNSMNAVSEMASSTPNSMNADETTTDNGAINPFGEAISDNGPNIRLGEAISNPSQETSPAEESSDNNTISPFGESISKDSVDGLDDVIFPRDDIQFGAELSGEENNKKEKKKKENIFIKLFHILTEEVEEEEAYVPEQDATKLSQENLDILSSLDEAEENNKKKKKEKKKKEKKVKVKKAKPKPKKKKKAAAAPEDTKQIPKKHVMKTAAMAISLLVILLLLCLFLPEKLVVGEARESYYQEEYKDVFLSLYGKKLNESDQLIYDRSKLIVLLDRKYEGYENYKALGMKLEALNSLLEGMQRYNDIIERGEKLNVKDKLDEIRSKIIEALLSDYAMTETDALEILQYSELDYSNRLNSIVEGTPFIKAEEEIRSTYGLSEPEESNEEPDTAQLPDLLPEELEYQQSLLQEGSDNDSLDNENGINQESNSVDNSDGAQGINQNEYADRPSVGGAINQNGQSLQLQIDSEQF